MANRFVDRPGQFFRRARFGQDLGDLVAGNILGVHGIGIAAMQEDWYVTVEFPNLAYQIDPATARHGLIPDDKVESIGRCLK